MRKPYWLAIIATGMGIAGGTLLAADIGNLSGQSCGTATGMWHFVNNQTGGAAPGQLMALWSSGDSCTVSASQVNRNTQHFNCIASGALISASTNLPGKLVLSDFSCDSHEEPPHEEPPHEEPPHEEP